MHIAIVTTEYLPGRGGGVATYHSILAQLLVEAGLEVTVLVKHLDDDLPLEEDHGPLQIRRIPLVDPHTGISLWQQPDPYTNEMLHLRTYVGVFAREVARWLPGIHAWKPIDLVLSQEVEAPTYLLQNERLLFHRMAEVPFVVFVHSPHRSVQFFNEDSIYDRAEYHRVYYEEQSMALADRLLAASQYQLDEVFRDLGYPTDRTAVIPYPLGRVPPLEEPLPRPPALDPNHRHLVYAGRIEMRKGLMPLMEAFASLAADHPDLHLHLLGAHCHHAPLDRPVQEILLRRLPPALRGRVIFHGPVPREEIWAYFRHATLGVVPSLWEPFSFVAQEMMACALPVLATREVGLTELLEEGRSVFRCEGRDSAALAAELSRVLALPAEERAVVGREGHRAILAACNNEKVVRKTVDFFAETIEATRRSFARESRFPVPSNLPWGQRPLREAHPALAFPPPRTVRRVAVVLPCYNLGPYLNEAVESLRSQEGVVPEIFVVNDGSTERGTLEVLGRLRQSNDLRVLDTPNQGLPRARQHGAGVALEAGVDALVFLDADDWLKPSYLRKAVEILNRHPEAGAVNAWTDTIGLMDTYWIPPHSQFPLLLAECLSTPPAVVRREAYERAGGFSPALSYAYEDWDLWIALCRAGYALLTIPEPLIVYRMREGSMSHRYNPATREHGRRALLARHGDLLSTYGSEVLLLVEGYGYRERRRADAIQQAAARAKPIPPLDKRIYRSLRRFFRGRENPCAR